jgi:hypothetical protein
MGGAGVAFRMYVAKHAGRRHFEDKGGYGSRITL